MQEKARRKFILLHTSLSKADLPFILKRFPKYVQRVSLKLSSDDQDIPIRYHIPTIISKLKQIRKINYPEIEILRLKKMVMRPTDSIESLVLKNKIQHIKFFERQNKFIFRELKNLESFHVNINSENHHWLKRMVRIKGIKVYSEYTGI